MATIMLGQKLRDLANTDAAGVKMKIATATSAQERDTRRELSGLAPREVWARLRHVDPRGGKCEEPKDIFRRRER
jgi:hypothetical protein